jgi:hypothetical protein
MAIFAMLQRNLETEDLQELYNAVNSTNPEKVRKAYYYMTGFLDKIRFIKIDRKKVYDETDAAAEDEIKTQGDDDPDEEFE